MWCIKYNFEPPCPTTSPKQQPPTHKWLPIQHTKIFQGKGLTLKMNSTQVVETSVTVNNNSPIQDHVNPDDQTQPTFVRAYSWNIL